MTTPAADSNLITLALSYDDMAKLWAQAAQTGTHPADLVHRYVTDRLHPKLNQQTLTVNIDSDELYKKLLTHIRRNRP